MKKATISTLLFLILSTSLYSMQIFVNTFADEEFTLDVEASDIISDIKQLIQDEKSYPVDEQILIFSERILENNRTLSDYNIQKQATLFLTLQTPTFIHQIPDTIVYVNDPFSYTIPASKFSTAPDTIFALKEDGEALPSWLSFNKQDKLFNGTPTQTGILNVVVHISNSTALIFSTDTFKISVNAVTEIESQTINSLQIYPNPVLNKLHLTSTDRTEDIDYVLYNSKGQMAKEGVINSGSSINMQDCKAGLYFIKLSANQSHIKTIKFLKE